MYKKYLIIASKTDLAGMNITSQLSQFRENPMMASMSNKPSFDFYFTEKNIIDDSALDLQKIEKYDFVIFASKHSSSISSNSSSASNSVRRTLSIHAPGNWGIAKLGGKDEKVCKTSALFQKQMFELLNANKKQHGLNDFEVTLECTHHGPLIEKPCLFIEIGPTEEEWKNKRAGFVIALTIRDIIQQFKPNPYQEIAIGIGGPHYCPNFNKIQLNSNYALSHIIPSYVLPITEEMIHQATQRTEEEIDFVLLDWKGLPNAEERQRIIKILDKNYLQYKKTSEVEK